MFIAALRHDAITAPWVIDGPINGEAFRTYIEQVLVPTRECPVFGVWLIWSMLPERSKDDDDFQRTSGRTFEGLCAA